MPTVNSSNRRGLACMKAQRRQKRIFDGESVTQQGTRDGRDVFSCFCLPSWRPSTVHASVHVLFCCIVDLAEGGAMPWVVARKNPEKTAVTSSSVIHALIALDDGAALPTTRHSPFWFWSGVDCPKFYAIARVDVRGRPV